VDRYLWELSTAAKTNHRSWLSVKCFRSFFGKEPRGRVIRLDRVAHLVLPN